MTDQGKTKGKSKEQGEKAETSLKNEGKLEGQNMQKSVSLFSLCSVTYFGSSQMKQNQTYPLLLIYQPLLHLQSRKKNYDKEKSLKTVIISVLICILLYMVHSSGSQSKKSDQNKRRKQQYKDTYQKCWEIFPSVFGGHSISMNIPPGKGERHYAYSLGTRQDLKYTYKPTP
jgi:hypothetical protein